MVHVMKTLWKTILFLVIIGTFSYSIFLLVAGPCYAPKEYSMGVYDERFSVTEVEFIAAAQAAERACRGARKMAGTARPCAGGRIPRHQCHAI